MVEQATKAGVQMKNDSFMVNSNPVLHDKSDAIRFGPPIAGSQISNDATWNSLYDIPAAANAGSGAEDRDVHYGNSSSTTQRQMTGTNMTNSDTEQFITYDPTRSRPDNITGTINMDGYRAWLLRNGYNISKLTIQ